MLFSPISAILIPAVFLKQSVQLPHFSVLKGFRQNRRHSDLSDLSIALDDGLYIGIAFIQAKRRVAVYFYLLAKERPFSKISCTASFKHAPKPKLSISFALFLTTQNLTSPCVLILSSKKKRFFGLSFLLSLRPISKNSKAVFHYTPPQPQKATRPNTPSPLHQCLESLTRNQTGMKIPTHALHALSRFLLAS